MPVDAILVIGDMDKLGLKLVNKREALCTLVTSKLKVIISIAPKASVSHRKKRRKTKRIQTSEDHDLIDWLGNLSKDFIQSKHYLRHNFCGGVTDASFEITWLSLVASRYREMFLGGRVESHGEWTEGPSSSSWSTQFFKRNR